MVQLHDVRLHFILPQIFFTKLKEAHLNKFDNGTQLNYMPAIVSIGQNNKLVHNYLMNRYFTQGYRHLRTISSSDFTRT